MNADKGALISTLYTMQVTIDHLSGLALFRIRFALCLFGLMALLSALSGCLFGAYLDWFDAPKNLTTREIHPAIQSHVKGACMRQDSS